MSKRNTPDTKVTVAQRAHLQEVIHERSESEDTQSVRYLTHAPFAALCSLLLIDPDQSAEFLAEFERKAPALPPSGQPTKERYRAVFETYARCKEAGAPIDPKILHRLQVLIADIVCDAASAKPGRFVSTANSLLKFYDDSLSRLGIASKVRHYVYHGDALSQELQDMFPSYAQDKQLRTSILDREKTYRN